MNAKVSILFTITDIIDDAYLQEAFDGNFDACVRELIKDGLIGVVSDEYSILSIEKDDSRA